MGLSLNRFDATGETAYINKHNQNAQSIETAVDGLTAQVSATAGSTLSLGAAFSAMFGASPAIVGKGSYLPTPSGTTLNVAGGYFWRPSNSTVVRKATTTAISFVGVAAGTYYLQVDATGAVTRSDNPAEAVYSVVWTGSAFGTITRLANIVYGGQDWIDMQPSAALGASYYSPDERLEAGEALAKGAVQGPASAVNNHIPQFDGTSGKLVKDGLALDTDTSLAANSDTRVASQKAVKTYVDSIVTSGASDVMVFKGVIDCSTNPNYPAADAGNLYKVSVAGKIGGSAGPNVEAGDTLYCITDSSASGNHATVGANWVIAQVNLDGALTEATVHAASGKTTPVDADETMLLDSAASFVKKVLTWANLKATLKTYFDTLYASINPKIVLAIACSDETTALTTGTNKAKFINPYSTPFNVTAVVASLSTAQASGSIFTVDINEAGTSILSTKLTIDNTETNSSTAATAAVISDASIAAYAEIEVDIDQVGDGTAKGLKVYLIGYPS